VARSRRSRQSRRVGPSANQAIQANERSGESIGEPTTKHASEIPPIRWSDVTRGLSQLACTMRVSARESAKLNHLERGGSEWKTCERVSKIQILKQAGSTVESDRPSWQHRLSAASQLHAGLRLGLGLGTVRRAIRHAALIAGGAGRAQELVLVRAGGGGWRNWWALCVLIRVAPTVPAGDSQGWLCVPLLDDGESSDTEGCCTVEDHCGCVVGLSGHSNDCSQVTNKSCCGVKAITNLDQST